MTYFDRTGHNVGSRHACKNYAYAYLIAHLPAVIVIIAANIGKKYQRSNFVTPFHTKYDDDDDDDQNLYYYIKAIKSKMKIKCVKL